MDPLNGEMYGSFYTASKQESCLSDSLPSCVEARISNVSEQQKVRDLQLPQLLAQLDESFTASSEINKGRQQQLAREIVFASSAPIRKYRLLDFFQLLESNRGNPDINLNLTSALTILLKYATNLMKEEKHPSWRKIKFKLQLMQDRVLPIKGTLDILKQLGYTEETDTSLSFPEHVLKPDLAPVVVLAADLVVAICEVAHLCQGQHPFLVFAPHNLLDEKECGKPKEKTKPVPKPRKRTLSDKQETKPYSEIHNLSDTTRFQPQSRNRSRALSSDDKIKRPPPLFPDTRTTSQQYVGASRQLAPSFSTTVDDQGFKGRQNHRDNLQEETISCPSCMLLRSSLHKTCPSCGLTSDKQKPIPKKRISVLESNSEYVDMTASLSPPSIYREPMGDRYIRKAWPEDEEDDTYMRMSWKCEHCTFSNQMSTHICDSCYRTPSNLQQHHVTKRPAQQLAGDSRSEWTTNDMYSEVTPRERRASVENIYSTPKIYSTLKRFDQPPPLPPKFSPRKVSAPITTQPERKTSSERDVVRNSMITEAQMEREAELSEKERIRKRFEEKKYLYSTGQITEEEFNDADFDIERMRNAATSPREMQIEDLILQDVAKSRPAEQRDNELGMSDEQLLQLLSAGGFAEDVASASRRAEQSNSRFIKEPTDHDYSRIWHRGAPGEIPSHNDLQSPADLFDSMFNEFCTLNMQAGAHDNDSVKSLDDTTYRNFFNYRVAREVPYDALRDAQSMPLKKEPQPQSLYSFPSLSSCESFLEEEGRIYLSWIKQAENAGFSPAELNLAKNLSWQDPKGRDPVQWLEQEWNSRIAQVMGMVEQKTANENDHIGNISTEEVKEALLDNHGSVESACKTCIESRREKLAKMTECSTYGREECLAALDDHKGNIKQALFDLEEKTLEPLRIRLQSDETDSERYSKLLSIVRNPQVSFERRVRVLFAEFKMRSWGRAEVAAKLIDRKHEMRDSVEAAQARGTFAASLEYLKQECPICMDEKPMGQMITYLNCQDRICKECIIDYLTCTVRDKNILQLSCPVCDLPDLISDEGEATNFFNHLDIMMREIVEPAVHDLFQQKLRDRTLQKEHNFRWCAHCASGFIVDIPNVYGVTCPTCKRNTCFKCKKKWEPQHEGITCEEFARWKEENDEDFQREGLAGHLARHGIECPNCNFRYDLAKGGCLHFTCNQCRHEFCCGCFNPMKRGSHCQLLPSCANIGLHCHHPRACLFYLRDWEPQRLQQLLNNHEIDYRKTQVAQAAADANNVQDDGEARGTCNVMEQKEGPNGLTDDKCGAPCEDGHENLCKVHYNEYLVGLINKNEIDPAVLMNSVELATVLQRGGIDILKRDQAESDELYKERLLNEVVQKLPLHNEGIYEEPDELYINQEANIIE